MAIFSRNTNKELPSIDPNSEQWHPSIFEGLDREVLVERGYLERLGIEPDDVLAVSLTNKQDIYRRPYVEFQTTRPEGGKSAIAAFNSGLGTDGQEVLLLQQPPLIGSDRRPGGLWKLAFGAVLARLNHMLGTV